MVRALITKRMLCTPRIIDAFFKIDRVDFVPRNQKQNAHLDTALPLDFPNPPGRSIHIVSQPSTVAFLLELLAPEKNHCVLHIGTGSAYTTALLARIVGNGGYVFGLEKIPNLVKFGKRNVEKYKLKNVVMQEAGPTLGMPERKFHRILVSASAKKFPESLLDQLEDTGILVMPIQNIVHKVAKEGEHYKVQKYPGFTFTPLITETLHSSRS